MRKQEESENGGVRDFVVEGFTVKLYEALIDLDVIPTSVMGEKQYQLHVVFFKFFSKGM